MLNNWKWKRERERKKEKKQVCSWCINKKQAIKYMFLAQKVIIIIIIINVLKDHAIRNL